MVIEGLGTGVTAEAVIDVDRGIVTGVNPTNNGTGYFQTGNRVTLEGGFPLETRSFKVNAADEDGSVVDDSFVNGAPLQVDRFPPYEFEWPTGAAGYYDIFFEVLDNQGNRNVSSVMRRKSLLEAPQFDFQPASPAIVSANLDTNGSWEKETCLFHIPVRGIMCHWVVFLIHNSQAMVHQVIMISNGKVTDVQITSEGTGYSQNSEIRLVGG